MRQGRVNGCFALLLSILLFYGTIVSSAIIPREISFPRNTIGAKVEARAPLVRRRDVTPPVPDVTTCNLSSQSPRTKRYFIQTRSSNRPQHTQVQSVLVCSSHSSPFRWATKDRANSSQAALPFGKQALPPIRMT